MGSEDEEKHAPVGGEEKRGPDRNVNIAKSITSLDKDKTTFPARLHLLLGELSESGDINVIGWQPHGRCFLVRDQKRFVKEILPTFRMSHYSSFQRQLNLYGFKRLTTGQFATRAADTFHDDDSPLMGHTGRDKGAYWHHLFVRGDRQQCYLIKRVKVKGTGHRKPSVPSEEPDFYSMPPLDGDAQMKVTADGQRDQPQRSDGFSNAALMAMLPRLDPSDRRMSTHAVASLGQSPFASFPDGSALRNVLASPNRAQSGLFLGATVQAQMLATRPQQSQLEMLQQAELAIQQRRQELLSLELLSRLQAPSNPFMFNPLLNGSLAPQMQPQLDLFRASSLTAADLTDPSLLVTLATRQQLIQERMSSQQDQKQADTPSDNPASSRESFGSSSEQR